MDPCPVPECGAPQANGTYPWCAKHLARYRRHGDPLTVKAPKARISADGSTRECCRCGQWKPLDEFYPEYAPGKGKRSACRACLQAEARDKYRENPDMQARRKRRYVLRLYGISLETYEAVLAAQGGVCAICREQPDDRALAVDHDHETGAVRGLLCGLCNMSLGRVESPGWLDAARAYLEAGADLRTL